MKSLTPTNSSNVIRIAFINMILSLFLTSCDKGNDKTLKADDAAVVQAGEHIYQIHCAVCHGKNLQGQANWRKRDEQGYLPAPPHDETGHTWHHADALLFDLTKYGPGRVVGDSSYKTTMPAYDGILQDQEIVAVLSYIKSTWPKDVRQQQEKINGQRSQDL